MTHSTAGKKGDFIKFFHILLAYFTSTARVTIDLITELQGKQSTQTIIQEKCVYKVSHSAEREKIFV